MLNCFLKSSKYYTNVMNEDPTKNHSSLIEGLNLPEEDETALWDEIGI